MEGLSEQEQAFFKSGGTAEVEGEAAEQVETPEAVPAEPAAEPKAEERKRPSKFTYSEDTDNVVDDLGRKYIPHAAVREAREENKALKKAMDELQGRFAKFEDGEKKLQSLMQRLQPDQPAAPEYDKDPLGFFKHENQRLKEEMDALKKGMGETQAQTQQQWQMEEFKRRVSSAEASFAAKQADYAEAAQYVRNLWREEMTEAGIPDEQMEAALFHKGAQFAAAAMKRGANPAEVVYNLSKKFGYKAAEKKDPAEKIKQVAQGQEAAKSLQGGKSGGFSLETLGSMSDEDLEAFVTDPKKWAQLSKAA